MILALVGAVALAATCPEPTDTQALVTALNAADAAFAGMSLADFEASRARAVEILPCLDEALTAADAAQLHRVEAYGLFLAQDLEGSQASMVSMLRVQPSATLPTAVAPEGHPLYEVFAQAATVEPVLQALTRPAGGALWVDGRRGEPMPVNEPAVLQLIADDGAVVWTQLVRPGDALPEWEPAPPQVATGGEEPLPTLPTPEVVRRPWPLVGGAAASALLAGALYVGAGRAADDFDALVIGDGDENQRLQMRTDAEALQRQSNGLTVASGVTAGVALGLGAVAVVRW